MKHPKNRLHSVMIIGATPAGVAAANKLGELGIPVTLVEKDPDLDRKLTDETYRLESGVPFNFAHRPGLIRILRNPNIRWAIPATISSIKHSSQGFRVQIEKEPTYVDPERCTLCGRCTHVCPVVSRNGRQHPIHVESRMSLPGRATIDKRRQPLCQANCPLNVNVQGYMALTAAGRYREALDLIRKDNVLPGICGRICTNPCEAACRRAEKDGALAIRDIKRFVADYGNQNKEALPRKDRPNPSDAVAVVGSGPAGLAAATDLARQGYAVTVFEREKEAGGLLRYGIGPHRLPREILDAELAAIAAEGVEFVTEHEIALPEGLTQLRKSHRAVITTVGSWADRRLGVEGEDLDGVEGCLTFLNQVYRGEINELNEKVAVIGDGNAAFDMARVLRRLGAEVSIVSWFAQDEIPADPEEVHAALAEGITICDRTQTVGFAGRNGRMEKLRLRATRPGPQDESGIAWPEIIPESAETEKTFDRAFVAIGQTGAYSSLNANNGFKVTDRGLLAVDDCGRLGSDGIYAAGDAVTGASTVVQAMAQGRKIAAQVLRDLKSAGNGAKTASARPELRDFDPISADLPVQTRCPMPELPIDHRRANFKEVAMGFDQDQAKTEAERCLQCGSCSHCFECLAACQANQAIRHDDQAETILENAGVLIVADAQMAPGIRGDDVIRAYGPPTAKTDVRAMMMRGFSAAAKAMVLLQQKRMRMNGHGVTFVPPDTGLDRHIRMGIFACRCNDSLGWTEEMDLCLAALSDQTDVAHAEALPSACTPEGIRYMVETVRAKGLTRLVLASCVCCPLNFVCSACTDQRSRLKQGLFEGTGISRSMVQTCDLRGEVLRHVATDASLAGRLFEGLVTRSAERARRLMPFPAPVRNYNFTTAVIGQSEATQHSALTLAQAGFEVLMFGSEKHPLDQAPLHADIFAPEKSCAVAVRGSIGNFQVQVRCGDSLRNFTVGGVILAEAARNNSLFQPNTVSSQGKAQAAIIDKDKAANIPFMFPCSTAIAGLFQADPSGINISKRTKGEATAASAAAAMPRGPRQSRGFSVVIDETRCRGCGRCIKACPYQAVTLKTNGEIGFTAEVDDVLCKGCGNCISVCPSNAADSPFRDQGYLERTVEELLLAGSGR